MPDRRPYRADRRVLTGIEGNVPTVKLMSRQQRLQGVTVGSRRHQQEMVRGLDATGLKPVIDKTLPLGLLSKRFATEEDKESLRENWELQLTIATPWSYRPR